MPECVLLALRVLAEFCMSQDNCATCKMREYCGKLPSEFELQ